jgi:hypothetical protein
MRQINASKRSQNRENRLMATEKKKALPLNKSAELSSV